MPKFSVFRIVMAAGIFSGAAASASAMKTLEKACAMAVAAKFGCVSNTLGIVVASDNANAQRVAPYAAKGEARFARFFGKRPADYAFINGNEERYYDIGKHFDFPAELFFPSASDQANGTNSSIRRAIEAAYPEMAPEEREAKIQSAIAASGTTVEKEQASDSFTVPHELGHIWLIKAYWPNHQFQEGVYMSPAPDWLDEGTAQLMEADGSTRFKRNVGLADLKDDKAVTKGFLKKVLSQEHPMTSFAKFREGKPKLTGISEKDLAEAGIEANATAIFYARSAALADFLIERSGKETILADIAQAYSDGRGFEKWHAKNGQKLRLGRNLDEMDGLFLAWVRKQLADIPVRDG